MISIHLEHNQYRKYHEKDGIIFTGSVFLNDSLCEPDKFCEMVKDRETEPEFIETIKKLNGFFAIAVHKGENELFAAVDRVRSIPLFYGQRGNDFFLSDSAEWIRQQVGNTEIDPLAREEFLLTGYVTGLDTLFLDVKQLQAGEALSVQDDGEKLNVKTIRYYQYIHKYDAQNKLSMEELMEKHDQVLLRVFNRLIKIADGRPIVIPLSGGYDSRLIVLMLKRLGYKNIITFSYGRPGNKESEVSRKVAESLGLRWEFVEYSNELWHEWYHSDEYNRYAIFADGLASLPHIQDWPAVWQLKNNKIIPNDSIFVPGHSADLLAGSRSKSVPGLYVNRAIDIPQTIAAILKYHYSLFDWTKRRYELEPLFIEKIKQTLGCLEQFPDGASAFESWDIAERQSKFIINSLRVYEFWGYNWWMPFWDYEYMKFWCSVPLEYRIDKSFYNEYVERLYMEMANVEKCVARTTEKSGGLSAIKDKISMIYFSDVVKSVYHKTYKKHVEYNKHPLAWYGIMNKQQFKKFYTGKENINSFLAAEVLGEINLDG